MISLINNSRIKYYKCMHLNNKKVHFKNEIENLVKNIVYNIKYKICLTMSQI